MQVVTVCGNRPQFIKASAVSRVLREQHSEILIHTGQHHDQDLSQIFFDQLNIPKPDYNLAVAGGSNSQQLARMIELLEPLLKQLDADAVLVYGDTNSTLAGAIVAAQLGIPVVHVEAGMRSFDRSMPEEINRVLVDHLSALLLTPAFGASQQLKRESAAGRVVEVGDVMVDVANYVHPQVRGNTELLERFGINTPYVLATAHRAGNVDNRQRLTALLQLLLEFPAQIVLPLHPRTRQRLTDAGLLQQLTEAEHIKLLPPLGYLEFSALLCQAEAALTDSGGVQKEAYLAGVSCITLRSSTEWTETVDSGWNTLVDLDLNAAVEAFNRPSPQQRPALYGDGKAGERVVAALSYL